MPSPAAPTDMVGLRVHNPGRAIAPGDLGLHLVRRIMEAHAGRIEVDSRDGAGTAFTVWRLQVASTLNAVRPSPVECPVP
ncbi:hypothetical protein FBZ82_10444 [Azospirillum brasilense]|uniref:Histidine kinase/HSP90-like ATPase domain-containing protein n=1 Tax=Azospirillum brasilense TaxID=192 RepID=A0A560BBA8_AZOBR|nr:hypothetical protein FBZ82_10444 [Azospirillum brasilense]